MAEPNDGKDAGAGIDGDQGKKASEPNDKPITLTNEHLDSIAQSIGEKLGINDLKSSLTGLQSTLGEGGDFRQALSNEITGAVKRNVADVLKDGVKPKKDADDGKGKGGEVELSETQLLAKQLKIDGQTYTVGDLATSLQAARRDQQEVEAERSQRAETDKIRSITDALRKKGFIGDLDNMARGYAANIEQGEDGKLTAKNVKHTNPLGTEVTEDMALDAFLDHRAELFPETVGGKVKPGTGGKQGVVPAGEPKYSLEKCKLNPSLEDEWMNEDPDGYQAAKEAENASALQRHIPKPPDSSW